MVQPFRDGDFERLIRILEGEVHVVGSVVKLALGDVELRNIFSVCEVSVIGADQLRKSLVPESGIAHNKDPCNGAIGLIERICHRRWMQAAELASAGIFSRHP